ncbi:helix-turn-helix domain-containing protein [Agrilactobacillus yilanensis]|uniref:Helix-turn-helix domain-containing protein n=1 Tax=Agrilactobacillus yilanensis TaxID=2485997 RepID=A0ABW4J825_9LACO|nr:helix-turn-helix transcriptional regulator [Agrilactobacillus yilanensis]
MKKDLTLVNPQQETWLNDLVEFQDAYGVTQQQLADTTGYSREYINALIRGRKQLTAQARAKLSDADTDQTEQLRLLYRLLPRDL